MWSSTQGERLHVENHPMVHTITACDDSTLNNWRKSKYSSSGNKTEFKNGIGVNTSTTFEYVMYNAVDPATLPDQGAAPRLTAM